MKKKKQQLAYDFQVHLPYSFPDNIFEKHMRRSFYLFIYLFFFYTSHSMDNIRNHARNHKQVDKKLNFFIFTSAPSLIVQ